MFLPDMPTAQLAVPTVNDEEFEPHTTVTAVVVPPGTVLGEPGHYVVRSPGSTSVLVRDNDVPGIDIYAASTQASVSEGSGFRLRVIAETRYDERPRSFDDRDGRLLSFPLAYTSESGSARFREDFEPLNELVDIFFSEFQRVSVDGGVTFFYRQVVEFPALVTIDDDLMEGEESLLLKLEGSANLHPQIRILSPGSRPTLTIEDNDFVTIATDPGIRIATGSETLGVVAKGTPINFVLTRPAGDLAPELPVTVITETEVGGTAPSTFTQTVVFPEGMATAQLTVPTANDEGMLTVTALVIPPDPPETPPERTSSGKYYNAASTPASVLVLDDDTALVTITAGVGDSLLVEVTEGDEMVFELTRTGDPASSLTVGVAIDEPQDDNLVLEETAPFEKTVVFPVGESTVQLTVPTVNDDAYEQPTAVTAGVSLPDTVLGEPGHYYVRSPGSASVRVLDDGFPAMRIYIASTRTSINEGHGVYQAGIVIDAEAPPPSDSGFSISFSTKGNSADSPEDYPAISNMFSPGLSGFELLEDGVYRKVVYIPVTIDDDDLMEGDETFGLVIERAGGLRPEYVIDPPGNFKGSPSPAHEAITIVDNDFVTIAPDLAPDKLGVAEGNEIVFVLTRPAVESTAQLTVTVAIGEPQDANRVLEDTAPFEKEVMFLAGDSMTQLTVRTANDATVEPDTTVTAVVLPPDPSIAPPTGLESGEYYNAASTPASLLVFDDDTTIVTITAVGAVGDSRLVEVDEGEEIVFELTRAGNLASSLTLMVSVEIDEPQDANRVLEDTASSIKTVVFPVGESTTQLTVPTVDDDAYQQPTTVTVVVLPPDTVLGEPGHYEVGSPGSASVRVLDDGFPAMRIYTASTQTRLDEGHGVYQAGIVMDAEAPPPSDRGFFISFSTRSGGAGIPEDSPRLTISFNPGHSGFKLLEDGVYRKVVYIPVTINDDDLMEGDERLGLLIEMGLVFPSEIVIDTPGNEGFDFSMGSVHEVITIVDNDFVTIAPDKLGVAEGTTINFVLTRPGGDLTSSLTVTVQIEEPQDANRVLEDTAPFTQEAVFLAGDSTALLTVPTVDDAMAEPDTTVTAVVLPPDPSILPPTGLESGEYYNAASTPASVVVLDDDTALVTITAVGAVGPSGLVEVIEGRELVFELTRTEGNLSSPLTAVVGIDEAGGDILADSVRSTEAVMFLPDMPTAQLAVPTVNDEDFEPHTTVTAVVVPPGTVLGEPGHYAVGSPGSTSVLVRDNDVPGINVYAASTQVSVSEGSSFRLRVIAETLSDERPRSFDDRDGRLLSFGLAYFSESRSAQFLEDFEPVNEVVEIFFSEFQRVSRIGDEGVTFFYRQVVEFPALVTIDDDLMEGEESLLLKMERSANLHPQIRILSPGNRVTLTIEDNDFVTIATDPGIRIAADPDTTLGVVAKGTSINFVLTRPAGDLAPELPVTVITETEVGGTTPSTFTQTVVFPEGTATAQLTVPTANDEGMSTVTAVVIPPDPPETPPERTSSGKYYNAASTPASVLVLDDDTALVTITAGVGDSLLVKVTEGDEIVFELTRTGDLASSLTVGVAIEEPQDANRVLEETAPFDEVYPACGVSGGRVNDATDGADG